MTLIEPEVRQESELDEDVRHLLCLLAPLAVEHLGQKSFKAFCGNVCSRVFDEVDTDHDPYVCVICVELYESGSDACPLMGTCICREDD